MDKALFRQAFGNWTIIGCLVGQTVMPVLSVMLAGWTFVTGVIIGMSWMGMVMLAVQRYDGVRAMRATAEARAVRDALIAADAQRNWARTRVM